MEWGAAHREAMVAAFDAHEQLGIDTFGWVDVFDAMVGDGLRLVFRRLEGSAALYLPASLGVPAGAIINAQHPLALQRYSAAHEYGHHVFGHGEQIDHNAEPRGTGAALSKEEKLAEAFAAWFLMPPEAAQSARERLGLTEVRQPADAYALALRMGTTYSAVCTHLPSLKFVNGHLAGKWREISLKTIKLELSATPPSGGWHNDLWVLSTADAEEELVVRAGDRLLIDLPGYDIDALPAGASAELLAPADLLASGRWQVDLPATIDGGPTTVALRDPSTRVGFSLMVERPRLGRYLRRVAARQ
ncbi:MAG: ImmA/IrrE family metallo-endopeptidase [Solirubrobacteraceae bacterium]